MPTDQSLLSQQYELKRLNFRILQVEPKSLVASRRSFYWDCFFTLINYTVFVQRVKVLSVQVIESDRLKFLAISKKLNPSFLPKGFQSGDAILVIYIADQVDVNAQLLCESNPRIEFAHFYIPAALDLSRKTTFFAKCMPIWGRVYYRKFSYILKHLFAPNSKLTQEPLSIGGAITALIYLVSISLIIFLFFASRL
jgi:hypothetical protein